MTLTERILDTLKDQTAGGHWIEAKELAIAAGVSVVSVRKVLAVDPTVLAKAIRRPTMTRKGKNGTHRVVLYQARCSAVATEATPLHTAG